MDLLLQDYFGSGDVVEKSNNMEKKSVGIKIGFIISGLIIVTISTYMLVTQLEDYRKASNLYSDTEEQYVSISDNNAKDENDNKPAEDTIGWAEMLDVDMEGLQGINKDVVGWIYFENIDISYPVLYSGDDSTYLRQSYTGEYVQAGSIFMEGENSEDFSDAHTIIYGHNMKDLSMFGKLRYYAADKDYALDHEYFQIITDKKKYRYKIFYCKIVSDDSEVYTVYKKNNQDFVEFANGVLQNGNLTEGKDIKDDDYLITLSTCSGDNRLIVSAVRCDEAYIND